MLLLKQKTGLRGDGVAEGTGRRGSPTARRALAQMPGACVIKVIPTMTPKDKRPEGRKVDIIKSQSKEVLKNVQEQLIA